MRLFKPETGLAFITKKGQVISMRPPSASRSVSIFARSSRIMGSDKASRFSERSATKRDMCVPLCSAGSATYILTVATVG